MLPSCPPTCLHGALLHLRAAAWLRGCLAQGKRVLELGCGCGLVGLVWAGLGAEVLLTDLPQVMVRGVAQHGVRVMGHVCATAWGTCEAGWSTCGTAWGTCHTAWGTCDAAWGMYDFGHDGLIHKLPPHPRPSVIALTVVGPLTPFD